MPLVADARIILTLLRGLPAGATHADRLQRFYAPQAGEYDRFRERLLHGRAALLSRLPLGAGANVVELGAGTGRNIEFFGERLAVFDSVTLVDLCPALIHVARERTASLARVSVVEGDATTWQPDRPVDCVYFSYALTMIPDWRRAIDNAIGMLAPGGMLGVVDFHIAPHHGALARHFWPRWFRHDGVRLSDAHLPHLRSRLEPLVVEERRGSVPYIPGAAVPYYVFIGRKRAATRRAADALRGGS